MKILFISDLHLNEIRPHTSELFLKFLSTEALTANAVYILGDFFEVWLGDDNKNPHDNKIIEALAHFTKTGIPLYFMRGNRDFLIGEEFIKKINGHLISDPTLVEMGPYRVFLMHGDLLCTKDWSYQLFRRVVRNPIFKRLFLSLPFSWRQFLAGRLRKLSNSPQKQMRYSTSKEKYEVVEKTVAQKFKHSQANYIIHGHTHQAGIHEFILDGHPKTRIVLGEWDTQGSMLVLEDNSIKIESITKNACVI